MSVDTAKPDTATRLQTRALDTLKSHLLETILASEEPLRTVDIARSVADRLALSLSESEQGGLASLLRLLLDGDPLYSQANRQWDLALRMGRAEGDRRKPVERAVEDFIDLIGWPAEPAKIAVLLSAVYGRLPEYYEKLIETLAATREQFFRVGDRLAISRWLLDITSEDPADVEWDNFPGDELEPYRGLVKKSKAKDPLGLAREIVEAAGGEPVPSRVLQYLVFRQFPDIRPRELFLSMLNDERIVCERGPAWVTPAGYAAMLEQIRAFAARPELAADLVAAAVPEVEPEAAVIVAPAVVRVSDEDVDQVYEFMRAEERTYRLAELCQQALEAFPGSRTYQAVYDSLNQRLKEDPRFQWVGWDRFRLAGTIPQEVQLLPEGMAYDDAEYLGEDGAEVDRLVEPRDWKHGLEEQIRHYLVQDVGDDCTEPGAIPDRLVSSPPLHHYVAGTRYLRNSDRGFFPVEPDLLHVTIQPENGEPFEAWVNNRLGLIFGLKEWYDANLPWVGGRFTLERTGNEVYRLVLDPERDDQMDVPMEQLQQLLQLRGEAAEEGLPLTEIVTRILRLNPDGLTFVQLFTRVNIVRRTRRATLASILSGQRFFTTTSAGSGVWIYDEKRAAKPKKRGAPKRPRPGAYDEDDEEFLD